MPIPGRRGREADMRTLIFRTAAPYLTALMLLFSVFVLLRGHNEPGGGFIGGVRVGVRHQRHCLRRPDGPPRNALPPDGDLRLRIAAGGAVGATFAGDG